MIPSADVDRGKSGPETHQIMLFDQAFGFRAPLGRANDIAPPWRGSRRRHTVCCS